MIGKDIEEEFDIEEDGDYTLMYSPLSATEDIVIDFDIVRVFTATTTETVEKTRTVEYTEEVTYTEKVPYTVEVPYTETVSKEESYTLDYLRYAGIIVIIVGAVLIALKSKPK